MKIISADLLILYFKSLFSPLNPLNKTLGLTLICPKDTTKPATLFHLKPNPNTTGVNQNIHITFTGFTFFSHQWPSKPTSSYFALLIWVSLFCLFLKDCTRPAQSGEVLHPSDASEKLKDQSQITSLSGGLALRFRYSSYFIMNVYLWLVYTQNYSEITIYLVSVFLYSGKSDIIAVRFHS